MTLSLFRTVIRILALTFRSSCVFFIALVFLPAKFLRKRKTVGFVAIEFFGQKLGGFGGFGITAQRISSFFTRTRPGSLDITMLLTRNLPEEKSFRLMIQDSRVYTIPNPRPGTTFTGSMLNYAFWTNREIDALLSIDFFPAYRYVLNAMPLVPLVIWIRDPRSETEWKNIGTVSDEHLSYGAQTPAELLAIPEREREYFARVARENFSTRTIVFATNAGFLTERARQLYGLKEIRPFFLPNPIAYPDRSAIAKADRPTVCFMGRLDPYKRPWVYFELARRFKDVDFLVCGKPHFPKVMEPYMKKYSSCPNLNFLGLVQGEEKHRVLSRSWLLVNTSIHEGLPCSFLESFAYCSPVLSCVDPDGLVSRFGHYTGYISGNADTAEAAELFSQGLGKLLSDRAQLQALGNAARDHIEPVYSFPSYEARMNELLATAMKRNFTL